MEDWMKDMKDEAAEAQKKSSSGGSFNLWPLYGDEAIVQPGESTQLRLLPHKKSFSKKGYNPKVKPYFHATCHWYDNAEGKRSFAWCPRTFDEKAKCPICISAQELMNSSDKDERKLGFKLRAQDTFLFNAVIGQVGQRKKHEKQVEIRLIPLSNQLFVTVYNLMTGGEDASFARGNITHPVTGYELKLSRPAKNQKNARWSIDCAPKACKAVTDDAKDWGNVAERLLDPAEVIKGETSSIEEIAKDFHGEGSGGSNAAGDDGGFTSEGTTTPDDDSSSGNGGDSPFGFSEDSGGGDSGGTEESSDGDDSAVWDGFGMPGK